MTIPDVNTRSSGSLGARMRGVYLVTPDWDDTERLLAVTAQALAGGVALLQYRNKDADAALRRRQASSLQTLCRRSGVPFIINDHIDLCLELDADGVHVGATDMPISDVRSLVGAHRIVGASCYGDAGLAVAAAKAGASYLAFGGFYPSRVKKYPLETPLTILSTNHANAGLPTVAIGGIDAVNAKPLIAAGADMVAAISSVYGAVDPQQAVVALGAAFERVASA